MRFQGFREKFGMFFDLSRYSMKRRQNIKNTFLKTEKLWDNLTLSKHDACIYLFILEL